jgi:hypothetical protein
VIITKKDPIPWNNVYGTILGTLGNPNFISSFLGFSFTALVALLIDNKLNGLLRTFSAILMPIVVFEIIKTSSIQGLVVAAIGASLLIGVRVKIASQKIGVPAIYFGSLFLVSILAVLGALQKGPLSSILYKDSVSFRGEYWAAGIRMIKDNLFFGLGPDSYGNWYRFYRDANAIVRPGVETTANTAHNVFIDIGVNGGVPVLIAYCIMVILVFAKIIKVFRSAESFDRVFWTFAIIWICYQVQSIISINQIGLAIWGWIISGLILGYKIDQESLSAPKVSLKSKSGVVVSRQDSGAGVVFSVLGFIIGLVMVFPPVAGDHAWRAGLESSKADVLDRALLKKPYESNRLVFGSRIFSSNKLQDYALKFARLSVEHDPNNFESWKNLAESPGANETEIAKARAEMKRLDPLNPGLN